MKWALWAFLLIVQNFSFTMVSRARNSGSLAYHAIAAVFSNGVWFAAMFITVEGINAALSKSSAGEAVALGFFYTICTVGGSILSHYVLMRYVETGKRKVGGG